ncbi:hypothetical protein QWU01_23200 [Kluyvera cryocrescens]|uniref:Uncharacterized protein n=1 Tax=Kluyvera cryocrescens TaxID=580 RepID=A0AAW9CBS3_KLUCR|nr:hypothetical protein [Kluyvera cryocrescens]MDW3779710.1 hypothetical protein [Kluyvera cryocrescens]MEB7558735.1 hypothetical protein [Kluyvera cryocrescens]
MNLYMTLAPTRSRQILSENNWPTSVVVQPDAHCYSFTVSGHLDTDSIVALLPAIAARGHLDISAVHGLQQMSRDLSLCASITGEILQGEPCVQVDFEEEKQVCIGLTEAIESDLIALCRQIFIDASIISDMTGAQYEGVNIFERQTRHFWVFGEAWNDMPPLMRPDAEQQQLWLTEIFNHGSAVVAVGLAVYRDFDMIREGERSAGICIIRPGAPVRHWLPLKALHALADEVRQRIIHDRELTSSFS